MSGSLGPILRPRSVAVVGASRQPGTIGHELVATLVRNGFAGPVYPVNPSARSIGSVPAFATVGALPEAPDLAVIAVPSPHVLPVVRDCVARGVRGLVVISAGFREVGVAGAAMERELTELVRASGIRMVGPNCMGVLNTHPDVKLNATFAASLPPQGRIGFVSQSGGMGLSVLDHAREYGIGISQFVSIGNKPDVSGNDLLLAWEDDPEVEVILMYVESFGNPRRFLEIASRITRQKPIIVVKSGASRAGARAATSHTGALAASDAAVGALLEQAGVLRARTIGELFDLAIAFSGRQLPRSRRTAVLTNGGGPGILAADALDYSGLELAELAPGTVDRLRPLFPPEASLRNPVDMIASATPAGYGAALDALLDDAGLDAVVAIFVPPLVVRQEDVSEAIATAAGRHPETPVYAVLMGHRGLPQGRAALHSAGIPAYIFPESAARAIAAQNRYREWRERPPREVARRELDHTAIRKILATADERGADRLSELEALDLITAIGVPVAEARMARSVAEAVALGEQLGWPVVCKVMAPAISHKTEADGVHTGIRDGAGIRMAWQRIHDGASRAYPDAVVEGVLIQRQGHSPVELIVGMSREPGFGPLLMFGLGGTLVEVLRDVVFRMAPITPRESQEMLEGIRGTLILEGPRGAPKADREALGELLIRVGQLAEEYPTIAAIDLNPVLALGTGCLVVDARVTLNPSGTPSAPVPLARGS
ncbi:MAG: acetate--CoA ligase family protein [Gemmatimonadota bacterium]|nr:acetate--CoA ligase family protein [Gemmatimonadota bacterium]